MLRRALRLFTSSRDFALLMGAQFAAQAGDGLVQAALAKSIVFGGQEGFDLEGARSPEELLRIALYVFVPYSLLSPFLGVVIDRWDRRRLLVLANGFRGLVLLALGLFGTGVIGDAGLFLAFLLTLASTRVVLATKSAALPETLQGSSLVEANAVSQMGGAMAQLGGAGVALVAASFLAPEPIVLAGAIVYLAGAGLALLMRTTDTSRRSEGLAHEMKTVVGKIGAGIREVARTPQAGAAIATYFWLRLLWSFSIVGIGFITRELLGDDDLQVLLVTGGAGAAGAVLGFMSARRLHDRVKTTAHLVLSAAAVAGFAVAVLGGLETSAALGMLTFLLGFGFFLGKISLDTLVQEALGDDFRGRAFSLYDIAYNLAWVVAAAAMKVLWTEGSEGELLSGMGLVFLIGLLGIALWFRSAGLLLIAESPARQGA